MDWLGLKEKTVLVTGGALGIGRAIANGLAEVGANVVIADFNQEAGDAAVKEITETYGNKNLFAQCNVTDKASVDAAVQSAVDTFGRLDVLVNNAGINIPRLLVDPAGKEEMTEDIWDKVVAVNMKGQFLCAQAAARAMLADGKGGTIIMTNSESGMEGSEGQSVYAATKAAGYNMTRLAKELGKHGVRVLVLRLGSWKPLLCAMMNTNAPWPIPVENGVGPSPALRAITVDTNTIAIAGKFKPPFVTK